MLTGKYKLIRVIRPTFSSSLRESSFSSPRNLYWILVFYFSISMFTPTHILTGTFSFYISQVICRCCKAIPNFLTVPMKRSEADVELTNHKHVLLCCVQWIAKKSASTLSVPACQRALVSMNNGVLCLHTYADLEE